VAKPVAEKRPFSDTFPAVAKNPATSRSPSPSNPSKKGAEGGPDRSVWIDGVFRPWSEATIHILSHSLQRGSLVFDYMSVHPMQGGDPDSPGVFVFRMREHIERFLQSCQLMGLPLEQGAEELGEAICATVRANPGARAVKVSAYFASVEIDVVPIDTHVTVAIAAYDPKTDITDRLPRPSPPKPQFLKLWIEKERANRRDDIVPPQAKVSANYASPMTAKQLARAEGYDEILLVDEDGHLAEGPTANLFIVNAEGELLTPMSAKVLHGVTRSSIIELAKAEGIPFREALIKPDDLWAASEAFLTGTTAGVWAVESADGREIGPICPGPISTTLRDRFLRVSQGEDPEFEHWLTPVEA
jgi:branched-chain amino acid aminotransferase